MLEHRIRTLQRLRQSTIAPVLLVLVAASGVLAAECIWLRIRQQNRAVAWAQEKVAEKVTLARALLAKQKWNEAICQLEEAQSIELATNREEIRPLLGEAQRGQADEILSAAQTALQRLNAESAYRYLQTYLTHPQARQTVRAQRLRDDLDHALSDEEAIHLLASLSDGALLVFQNEGQLTADDGLHTEETRAIFRQTLRRHLSAEWRRRQAYREADRLNRRLREAEQARRIARLRQTRAFESLTVFLAQIVTQSRSQQQEARERETELEVLFEQLNVTDPKEKADLRADLNRLDEPIETCEPISIAWMSPLIRARQFSASEPKSSVFIATPTNMKPRTRRYLINSSMRKWINS